MTARKNYLRAIYKLTEKGEKGTTITELAEELEVSNATASETVQKLEEEKLLCRAPYKEFTLSPLGKEQAERTKEKYNSLKEIFQKIGVSQPKKEADTVEHAISNEAVQKLEKKL